MENNEHETAGGELPKPLGNLVKRICQVATDSGNGRDYPAYGGWSLVEGELRLTVFGPKSGGDSELLGTFDGVTV